MARCAHSPGTIVEVEPSERVWSTCVAGCDRPITRTYENVGDEDRIAGWGHWKPAVTLP